MKVLILAGGKGTRLAEETETKPKPMVQVGERPLLWHLMRIYAHYGFREFGVALGYKGAMIERYFANAHAVSGARTPAGARLDRLSIEDDLEHWGIELIDTGADTQTGGRLKRMAAWVGREPFMMTYGDGLATVDLQQLLAFHRSHGRLATVTAVHPPARFGRLTLQDDGLVKEFAEKPQIADGWINGGFFILEPQVLDYIDGDHTVFERDPMERLARDGQLMAFRHEGFWYCVDTLRDLRLLEELWETGRSPWKVWT